MEISVEAIKQLREKTGAGVMACRKVLQEVKGDPDKAAELLRQQGLAIAEKKAGRVANEGLIEVYVHPGGRLAAMVEINCETDFAARTPEFKELAHNLAMQVAATDPRFIDLEDTGTEGEANPSEACLLVQPFIKEPERTVMDIVNDTTATVGEKVRVRRFARFELGR